MKSTERQIMLYSDGKLNIELDEDVIPLKEVVVQSERDVRVSGLQMGAEKLDIKTMKQMPLAIGRNRYYEGSSDAARCTNRGRRNGWTECTRWLNESKFNTI